MGWIDNWDDYWDGMMDDDEYTPGYRGAVQRHDKPPDKFIVQGHIKHNGLGNPVETERAILWVLKNGSEQWIPKSQIYQRDNSAHIVISGWLADQKGWNQEDINQESEAETSDYDFDPDDEIPF